MGKRTGVRAKGKGIEIYFRYLGANRYEQIDLPPIARNLNAAAVKREQIIQKIKDNKFDYLKEFPNSKAAKKIFDSQGGNRVGAALQNWLERMRKEVRRSTWTDYKNSVAILEEQFGQSYFHELTRVMVRDFIYDLDVTQKRAANLLIPLRAVCREAHEDLVIKDDPIKDWRPRMPRKERVSEVDPFTVEEQKLLEGDSEIQAFIQFSIWSGLRTSEAIALLWSDITDVIDVNKGLIKGHVDLPKTKASVRKVDLRPKAKDALKLMEHTRFKKGRIFTYQDSKQVRSQFERLCKQKEVRYRKPYNTRHTFASMMLTANENPMWIAQQMGHTDVNMIFKVYGHFIPSKRNEGEKADKLFGE